MKTFLRITFFLSRFKAVWIETKNHFTLDKVRPKLRERQRGERRASTLLVSLASSESVQLKRTNITHSLTRLLF